MTWELIKKFMRDTEDANNIRFEDTAWQRAKQLEADINAAHQKEWDELVKSSDALLDEQNKRIVYLVTALRKILLTGILRPNEFNFGMAAQRLALIREFAQNAIDETAIILDVKPLDDENNEPSA